MACCENLPKESIMLTQGDDSNAMGRSIEITIETEEDLTGWSAIVQLEQFQWEFDDLTAGPLEWVITRDITEQLAPGEHLAAIKLFDSNDLCATVKRDIPVFVNTLVVENPVTPTPEPTEAQDGE